MDLLTVTAIQILKKFISRECASSGWLFPKFWSEHFLSTNIIVDQKKRKKSENKSYLRKYTIGLKKKKQKCFNIYIYMTEKNVNHSRLHLLQAQKCRCEHIHKFLSYCDNDIMSAPSTGPTQGKSWQEIFHTKTSMIKNLH